MHNEAIMSVGVFVEKVMNDLCPFLADDASVTFVLKTRPATETDQNYFFVEVNGFDSTSTLTQSITFSVTKKQFERCMKKHEQALANNKEPEI